MNTVWLTPGDALLIVDVQNDFLSGGSLAVPHGEHVIPVLNRTIALFQSHALPVIATRDWHPVDHCSFRTYGGLWPAHCIQGTKGAEFAADLALPASAIVISKDVLPQQSTYSGFRETDLADRLRALGVGRLFIGGIATDFCVLHTVMDALAAGFAVMLLTEAIRPVELHPDDGERAIRDMVMRGAQPMRLNDFQGDTPMSGNGKKTDSGSQLRLVQALLDGARYPHPAKSVRLFETHISWVLLAGRYAYKIKKALDLGFLDFTTLARRKFFCEEEIRINCRLAPHIYLDAIPIGGSADEPVIGQAPALEYAVRMRRFSSAAEMDQLLRRGKVLPQHIDSLAAVLAQFHLGLPSASPESRYGDTAIIRTLALQNCEPLPPSAQEVIGSAVLDVLRAATETGFAACEQQIEQRRVQGFVRECHGDLHLGNILIRGDKAVPFDGIEFDSKLRWIDIVNDIAFPFMDLLQSGRPDFAWRLLNGWLEITGDYAGLDLLRLYASYRAAVRGKVGAIRATQPGMTENKRKAALTASGRYYALAANLLARPRPRLIITHGLPGCGKTTFAQAALERLGAIRIRSDVERKRLFGLAPLARSHSTVGGEMYGADATRRTYDRLLDLARRLLAGGFTVIVDAAFLRHEERIPFRQLADELCVPFFIASIEAGESLLRARIEQRQRAARDASEADVAVLEALQAVQQPLQKHERACAVTFVNSGELAAFVQDNPEWSRFEL